MKTTVDAFGTEVIVGDTVVFMVSNRKSFETGEVVKCTKHGATISCNRVHENTCVNVRSERIYKVSDGQLRLRLGTNESITIPKKEYDVLLRDSEFLGELGAAGVYNWEGYDVACEAMNQ